MAGKTIAEATAAKKEAQGKKSEPTKGKAITLTGPDGKTFVAYLQPDPEPNNEFAGMVTDNIEDIEYDANLVPKM